jgi:hypothetical protein
MDLQPLGEKRGKSAYETDDYGNVGTVIRWLDLGSQGRVSVTYKSYLIELKYRRHKGWDMPKWSSLPIRFNKGKYFG